ncbi:OsmC family protein [Cocleimonas sp. KMM 6892]|uniref:OsmC family protein n=1 Tax=unclassified Cocleimonas TaxID=2639732 RepID=UPI002DBBAFD3|nr:MULTISPECIES: OsmC family protein [unclassified Cocleimonas]MEB8434072.1 OsmC family protein [Cocleimonas sp. KMM 6892]MEC4717068.1 OsmC family protein [Cocleimonas sp. KMM 6895]MEC4746344.1 OsmC family protein [Cocleimonas sp. KMM 6896]
MIIQVLGQTELRLSRFDEDGLDIQLENKVPRYSALAMFVTALGRCTFAVLDHYALRMDVPIENIVTHLEWDYHSDPTRFKTISMKIYWPELPEKRVASVERASHKCAISNTIKDCVDINVSVLNKSDA